MKTGQRADMAITMNRTCGFRLCDDPAIWADREGNDRIAAFVRLMLKLEQERVLAIGNNTDLDRIERLIDIVNKSGDCGEFDGIIYGRQDVIAELFPMFESPVASELEQLLEQAFRKARKEMRA